MTPPSLALRSFGVAFGEQVVLSNVSFALPPRELAVLMGPAGSGKSTLLRTLAGLNDCNPSLVTWGEVHYGTVAMTGAAAPPEPTQRPTLVMQHARFYLDTVRENLVSALAVRSSLEPRRQTELVVQRLEEVGATDLVTHLGRDAVELSLGQQRRLSIVRALMCDPQTLFVDEPTAGLADDDAAAVIALLRAEATRRAVLLVTHHQGLAVAAGGTTLLLAGGEIQEVAPTATFFASPRTDLARQFVRTGGCVPPPIETDAAAARDAARDPAPADAVAPAVPEPRSRFLGPRGFFWVHPGRLGGMPRPGIIEDLARDLEGLARLGVTLIVTLEEQATVSPLVLAALGFRSIHFPIVDMGVPPVEEMYALCASLARAIHEGAIVAVHCRAGLGRTGTVLACQLIFEGETARDALEAIRAINPRCIQSDAQVTYLRTFASEVARVRSLRATRERGEAEPATPIAVGVTKWH